MRKIYVFFLLVAVFLTGCSLAGDMTPPPALATSQAAQALVQPTTLPQPSPTAASQSVSFAPPNTERGAEIYFEKCAPCHGEAGLGDGPQANQLPNPVAPIGDTDLARSARPTDWYEIVTFGDFENFMPGFGSLSDNERWDVVGFAFSLSSNPADVQLGEKIFDEQCSDCHGADGSAPALAESQWITKYSKDDIVAIIRDGLQPGMPALGETLSTDEGYAVAEYLFDLSFPKVDMTPLEEEATLEGDLLDDTITEGSIRGQIINGSEGGTLPEEALEVTLYGFDEQQEVLSLVTSTEENGEYQFTEIEIQPGRVFAATVEYLGTVYASEISLFAEESTLDLPITIFDSTPDLTDLQVDRLHLIVDMPMDGVLQITELWILSNLGDRTIASATGEGILNIELPSEATNLSFESGLLGSRFQVVPEGFIDFFPIRPGIGSHEIVFSFNLPFSKSLGFSQPIPYPIEAVVLLSTEGIVKLSGDGLQDLGIRQMSGTALHNYDMGSISPGDELEFTVKREAGVGLGFNGSGSVIGLVVGVVIFAAALGGTGFWLYRRKKEIGVEFDRSQGPEEFTTDVEALDDQDVILQRMADLDDAYEARSIQYASYQKQRNALKRRLVEIMKQVEND